jgi:hypothetical protein
MRNGLVIFGLMPLAIGIMGFFNRPGWRSFCAGLVVASFVVVVNYARSIVFESRHLHAPRSFWRAREAVLTPRLFHLTAGFATAGSAILLIALTSGSGSLTAFLVAPLYLAWSVVALMWGKVPRQHVH